MFSATKVSRLETGRAGASPRDIRDLCVLYEIGIISARIFGKRPVKVAPAAPAEAETPPPPTEVSS